MGSSTPVPPLGSVPRDDHHRHGPNTDGTGRWSGGRVLVLNATYEPINVCTVRRATVLLLKEKAEVIEIGATDIVDDVTEAELTQSLKRLGLKN